MLVSNVLHKVNKLKRYKTYWDDAYVKKIHPRTLPSRWCQDPPLSLVWIRQ